MTVSLFRLTPSSVLLILVQVDTDVTEAEEQGRKQHYLAVDQHTWRDPKIPGILKNDLKYLYKFENLVPFKVLPPCNWMQQSQRRSHCWKHCLNSSTEMLSRAASCTVALGGSLCVWEGLWLGQTGRLMCRANGQWELDWRQPAPQIFVTLFSHWSPYIIGTFPPPNDVSMHMNLIVTLKMEVVILSKNCTILHHVTFQEIAVRKSAFNEFIQGDVKLSLHLSSAAHVGPFFDTGGL
jgi:hypothetical protein